MSISIGISAGNQRFEVATFVLVVSVIFFYTSYRIIYSLATIRMIEKGKRGISYLPRLSLCISELETYPLPRQEEFVVQFQKAPQPYRTEQHVIPVHCDLIKWAGSDLDIEAIGAGTCQIFFRVKRDAFVSLLEDGSTADAVHGTELPLLNRNIPPSIHQSEIQSFENSQMKFSIQTGIFDTINLECEIPIVVALMVNGQVAEYTCAFPSAIGSVMGSIFQFLPRSGGVLEVKSIYTSIGQEECMVCYDRHANTVVIPCRHCCVCTNCIRQLREPKCVVCRKIFDRFIFLPFRNNQPI